MKPSLGAVAVVACLACAPAYAEDGPAMVPKRDVVVAYRTEQGGQTLDQRLRWSAGLHRLRVDPPTPGMFVLVDYASRRMQIVREKDRTYVDMSAPPTLPGLGAPAGGTYKKSASDRILGLACTEWEVMGSAQGAGVCVTEDGVVLRVRMNGQTVATATSVAFSPQDPSLFAVPPGFSRVEPPR